MDWMEQEQERGITITSAATTCYLARHPDQHHRYPRPRGLHRRGGALAARPRRRRAPFSTPWPASQPQSETVWRQADKYHVPAHRFINKMDRWAPTSSTPSTPFASASTPTPCHPDPHRPEDKFKGVIDLVQMKAIVWNDETLGAEYEMGEIPEDLRKKAEALPRTSWSRAVAEYDDDAAATSSSTASRSRAEELRRGAAPAPPSTLKLVPGDLRHGFQEQGRAAAARLRWWITCPRRSISPPVKGLTPRQHEQHARRARPTTRSRSPRWSSRS